MDKNELKQLIRESVKDHIAKLKEKANNSRIAQAKGVCKILTDHVNALNKLIGHSDKLFAETQYNELNSHKAQLEALREKKIQKIAAIKSKYGIEDKPKKKKKTTGKKVTDTKTGMKKPEVKKLK